MNQKIRPIAIMRSLPPETTNRLVSKLLRVPNDVTVGDVKRVLIGEKLPCNDRVIRAFVAKLTHSRRLLHLTIAVKVADALAAERDDTTSNIAAARARLRYDALQAAGGNGDATTVARRGPGRPRVLDRPRKAHVILTDDLISRCMGCDWREKGLSDVVRRLLESGLEREMSREEGPLPK